MQRLSSCRVSLWIYLSLLTAVVLAGGWAALLNGQEAAPKARIPSKEAQAKAKALILDIFEEDLADAKEAAARSKLASYLLQQGRESKDEPANRYVLYQEARDLAARAGDAPLALSAIEELDRAFEVNVLELKAATLALAAEHASSKEANKALVGLLLPLIGEAVDADNYEAALKLGQVALDAAKKSKSIPLVTAVQKRNQEIQVVQKGFAHLKPFVDRLKKDAKDAEANLELGKYYGFLKGKWDRAVPLLAMGSDESLSAQARKDLARPKEGKGQLAVADGWWQLAGQEKDPAKLFLQLRAKFWYEKAILNLTGLNRTKADRRIQQVNMRVEGTPAAGPPGPVGPIGNFEGHSDEIKGVAFSADGRYAASGSVDKTVRIWNLTTGKLERTLEGHSKDVWSVVFHPNNRQVLSASWDGTVRLWDAKTGMENKRFTHPKDVNGVAISRDGSKILAGCDDHKAYLWNTSTGEEIRSFGGFSNYVYAVAFAPDGRHIACGSNDKSLRVFDLSTGQPVRVIESQQEAVLAVAFSPDSRFVFSCGDGAAHQWEIATGKVFRRFEGHTGRVLSLALSVDGRRLVTGGDDKTVRLWDVASGKPLYLFKGHSEAVNPAVPAAQGQPKDLRPIKKGHSDDVNAVAISSDGRRALSAGKDRTVRLWGLPPR